MAINCYSGLMGSGKTYEVVSSVIVQAVADGRRVVSNISGLDSDAIRAYCVAQLGAVVEACGSVVVVSDEQVMAAAFFPDRHAAEGGETKSIVCPGDLVAIDEAYKIWGVGIKIPPAHVVFFREHRHYTHEVTGVSCDLVLMTQDIGDLNRSIKVVIGNSFKCHKAKGLGLNNVYTITMWEGWKQPAKHIVNDWTKRYDPAIFPLYKSYAGTKAGVEVNADRRQNIFADRKLIVKIVLMLLMVAVVCWRLGSSWWSKTHPVEPAVVASSAAVTSPRVGNVSNSVQPGQTSLTRLDVSPDFRISGVVVVDGQPVVVLSGVGGVRVESATAFSGAGMMLSGVVDGVRVTRYSGPQEARGVGK